MKKKKTLQKAENKRKSWRLFLVSHHFHTRQQPLPPPPWSVMLGASSVTQALLSTLRWRRTASPWWQVVGGDGFIVSAKDRNWKTEEERVGRCESLVSLLVCRRLCVCVHVCVLVLIVKAACVTLRNKCACVRVWICRRERRLGVLEKKENDQIYPSNWRRVAIYI